MFLFWGIHLCYNVRKAPSAFNESKFISWSIYNLTVVTCFLKVTRYHSLFLAFRVASSLYFKARLKAKLLKYNSLSQERFCISLVLKVRNFGTRNFK